MSSPQNTQLVFILSNFTVAECAGCHLGRFKLQDCSWPNVSLTPKLSDRCSNSHNHHTSLVISIPHLQNPTGSHTWSIRPAHSPPLFQLITQSGHCTDINKWHTAIDSGMSLDEVMLAPQGVVVADRTRPQAPCSCPHLQIMPCSIPPLLVSTTQSQPQAPWPPFPIPHPQIVPCSTPPPPPCFIHTLVCIIL